MRHLIHPRRHQVLVGEAAAAAATTTTGRAATAHHLRPLPHQPAPLLGAQALVHAGRVVHDDLRRRWRERVHGLVLLLQDHVLHVLHPLVDHALQLGHLLLHAGEQPLDLGHLVARLATEVVHGVLGVDHGAGHLGHHGAAAHDDPACQRPHVHRPPVVCRHRHAVPRRGRPRRSRCCGARHGQLSGRPASAGGPCASALALGALALGLGLIWSLGRHALF